MNHQKIQSLNWHDVVILSIIFFGLPIATSLHMYWQLLQNQQVAPSQLSNNELASYSVMILEICSLLLAYGYLRWRRFDFSVLNAQINRYTLPLTVLLIVCAGVAADVFYYLYYWLMPSHFPDAATTAFPETHYTLSFILISLLNGFFEEIFFMGLVFAVQPKMLMPAVGYSLVIRFLFHTYQGLASAFIITTLGVVFFLFRRKIPYLLPFILAHGFFDVFGLSILGWFY